MANQTYLEEVIEFADWLRAKGHKELSAHQLNMIASGYFGRSGYTVEAKLRHMHHVGLIDWDGVHWHLTDRKKYGGSDGRPKPTDRS